ncbi:fungal-specific transcription factor domain-containing protein [Penicillium lagena]|uniref:fungal-specific transcription factor domain-containing protein n=1 Tax=Penicillium lagena TaxID=94218 RepID=UPI0025416259|nr:fungal-specific transcription factor domain-containing protein [Penicillium lagena]KAJ5605760.1 fungal-specific transcription factor domain-containing protein [Penicillium lagena]
MPASFSPRAQRGSERSSRRTSRVFGRVRTGCLTCRHRKKKCDEEKPQCLSCARNKLDCSWPPHITRTFGLDGKQRSYCDQVTSKTSLISCDGLAEAYSSPVSEAHGTSPETEDKDEPDIPNDNIVWSRELSTFLSPRRAGMLLPASQVLLSHYIEKTGPLLATAPAQNIPFVSWIMPIAYNDDLLMHSILALSGAHLSFKSQEQTELQQATYQHYCLVLRTLRRISKDEALLEEPLALLRVSLTLVILCHYETLSGDLNGSLFIHLRASRHLILKLQSKQREFKTGEERKLYGFIMEVYSYLVLSNNITPFGMNQDRALIHDTFLQSLDDLNEFGAFGVMFGGVHGLFELISQISFFAAQHGCLSEYPDPDSFGIYNSLIKTTVNWNPPATEHAGAWDSERTATLEVYRYALLIFLESTVSPVSKHNALRISHLQSHIDIAMSHLPQILTTNYSCILMWPLIIIGSCLVKEKQRKVLKDKLSHNKYLMRNTVVASWLLELLWADNDEYSIGPYGLGLLMGKHGYNYGVV